VKPILVAYATREGQARRIAEYLAAAVAKHNLGVDLVDVAHLPPEFSLGEYCAAIVSASIHTGKHETEATAFAKRYAGQLNHIPTAFVSVSLSKAGAEDLEAPEERRAQAAADVRRMIDIFLRDSGWQPTLIQAVAGALRYSQYNFLVRFVLKRISQKAGGDTDTSRDYEYTDWTVVDHIADELIRTIPAQTPA
jgi:menaquinone-dependent protoporphyrinogen oxidase